MNKKGWAEKVWISGAVAEWVLGATAGIGCNTAGILKQAGIPRPGENALFRNKPMLATEFTPFLKACLKVLAAHARGADVHVAAFDYSSLLSSCVVNCPTLHAAIAQARLFIGAVQGPQATPVLNTSPGTASFALAHSPGTDTPAALVVDFFELTSYYKLFSWLIGEPLRGHISLAHASAANAAALKGTLDCAVNFGSPVNCITFDASMLKRPLCLRYAEMAQLLEKCAIALLPLPGQRISDRLEMLIRRALETNSPIPYEDQIARQYGRSGPTLRRQLGQEGTTFRCLLNKGRVERAVELLRDTDLTIEQIAHRLTFSTASGFSRAFKRWTGMAPADYRNTGRPALTDTDTDESTSDTQSLRRRGTVRLAVASNSSTG